MLYTIDDFAITTETQVFINGLPAMFCDPTAEHGSINYPSHDQVELGEISMSPSGVTSATFVRADMQTPKISYKPVACIRTTADILARAETRGAANASPLAEVSVGVGVTLQDALKAAVATNAIHSRTEVIEVRGRFADVKTVDSNTVKFVLLTMIDLPRVEIRLKVQFPAATHATISADYADLMKPLPDNRTTWNHIGFETKTITVDVTNWTHFKHGDLEELSAHLTKEWSSIAPNAKIEVVRPRDLTLKEVESTWLLRHEFATKIANNTLTLDSRVKSIALQLTYSAVKPSEEEVAEAIQAQSSILSALLGRDVVVRIELKKVQPSILTPSSSSAGHVLTVPRGGDVLEGLASIGELPAASSMPTATMGNAIHIVHITAPSEKRGTAAQYYLQKAISLQNSFPQFKITYTTVGESAVQLPPA